MPATDSATDATVPEIFDRLASKGQVAPLRRTSGAYEFDFDGGGHWTWFAPATWLSRSPSVT